MDRELFDLFNRMHEGWLPDVGKVYTVTLTESQRSEVMDILGSTAPTKDATRDALLQAMQDHYWDSLESNRDLVMKHVEGVLRLFRFAPPEAKLAEAAAKFRDAFDYDPGQSDLDNEQPITIHVTLGDWRRLDMLLPRKGQ